MPKRVAGPFSHFIRQRRLELGKTQKQIAEVLGTTADFVTLAEAGERRIDLDRIPLLADALEIDRTDLCVWALSERAPVLFGELFAFAQQ